MRKPTFSLLLGVLFVLGLPVQGAPPEPTTEEIVAGIEATYGEVQSFRADFVQVSRSTAMGETGKQRGKMQVKRPRKMRWDFQRPDAKLFVTDGTRMWVYSPDDKQAILYENVETAGAGGMESLLTGLDELDEHFEVSQLEDADARRRNNIVLLLKPKTEGMNMKSLRIEYTRKKYNLQRLVMVDAFDNETELSFSQVRLNAPIDDSVFDFQPPAGVEVIKPEGL